METENCVHKNLFLDRRGLMFIDNDLLSTASIFPNVRTDDDDQASRATFLG